MTTQQLLSFIRTAQELSFTRAAEKLFLSVPTISRNIKSLESELNVSLLSRNRHGVELTDAGKSFYEDACSIVEAQEMAKRHAQFADKKPILRIGCTSPEEMNRIAAALSVFHSRIPKVMPKITMLDYTEGLRLLNDGNLDLMLGSDNMAKENEKCRFIPFGKQTSLALVPARDPLSGLGHVSFSELKERVLLCLPERMIPFYSRNAVKDFLAIHQKHVKDIECSDDRECIALVKSGYGVCLLPEYRIPETLEGIVLLSVDESETYMYGVLTGHGELSVPAHKLIDVMKTQFSTRRKWN